MAQHQLASRLSVAARKGGRSHAARAKKLAKYAADASLGAGRAIGSVTRPMSWSTIRALNAPVPSNSPTAFATRGPLAPSAGEVAFAAASRAHAWKTKNCVNFDSCAGSRVDTNTFSRHSFNATPSPESIRLSMCASTSVIIESIMSICSSISSRPP